MFNSTRLLLATALLGALAAPALAQDGSNPMASTQFPPSAGNSSEGTPQTLNSVPQSAATAVRDRPGGDVATTRINPVIELTEAADATNAMAD